MPMWFREEVQEVLRRGNDQLISRNGQEAL
jgi:hypothetical protein